jgi:rod shape-determining protein MreB and related proteins
MNRKVIGIDFGTTNTLIKVSTSDQIAFNEPSVLIREKDSHKVVEIGYLAYKLLGKVPENLEAVFPIKNGVVADKVAAASYLKQALINISLNKKLRHYDVIFSIPSSITPVEKEAILEVAYLLKAKNVYLADTTKASAIGSDMDINSTRGSMVVDIGGSSTNISCLAIGKIVVNKGSNIAGNTADESITRYIRSKYHLMISNKTSEYIKMKIGTLLEDSDNSLLEINGKDIITGLPHSVIVSTQEIQQVLVKVYSQIIDLIVDSLEIAPPEISSDIIHSGITLSGGGCLLNGVREFFQSKLSLPVHISPYPLEATINGLVKGSDLFISENKK